MKAILLVLIGFVSAQSLTFSNRFSFLDDLIEFSEFIAFKPKDYLNDEKRSLINSNCPLSLKEYEECFRGNLSNTTTPNRFDSYSGESCCEFWQIQTCITKLKTKACNDSSQKSELFAARFANKEKIIFIKCFPYYRHSIHCRFPEMNYTILGFWCLLMFIASIVSIALRCIFKANRKL